jgi:hypothetical protein
MEIREGIKKMPAAMSHEPWTTGPAVVTAALTPAAMTASLLD